MALFAIAVRLRTGSTRRSKPSRSGRLVRRRGSLSAHARHARRKAMETHAVLIRLRRGV